MKANLKTLCETICQRFVEIEEKLANPDIFKDHKLFKRLSQEQRKLEVIVKTYRLYQQIADELRGVEEFLDSKPEEELALLAKSELADFESRLEGLEKELQLLLLPQDEDDQRDVIVEIRGAAGGEEANLFAQDLLKIYQKWISLRNWKFKLLDVHHSEGGGFAQVVFSVSGQNVYGQIKFEAGVHRVQRVPITESIGRVHTSTVTVVVIPEMPPEEEIIINTEEIRVDTYRSSGAGGQSVNTTDSAVRITHLPTGIVVNCQQERSQLANRELALRILKAKLLRAQKEAAEEAESGFRKAGGSGARAEKIRTYNWTQDRVTDHRVALSLSLRGVLEGKIQPFIDALRAAEEAQKLAEANLN